MIEYSVESEHNHFTVSAHDVYEACNIVKGFISDGIILNHEIYTISEKR